MSQSISALATLPFELVYSDGEPLESEWHVLQNDLLRELILIAMEEQGRPDFYVGGNMFVYYSVEQAWDVVSGRPYFRGPDAFWVDGIKDRRQRKCWVSWEEGGRLPDVIFEMLSESTASIDRNEKKDIYEQIFHTSEYFLYEPYTGKLEGFRLAGQAYRRMLLNGQGRLWSERLGVFVGLWHGTVDRREYDWVRLFRPDGTLVPTKEERAEAAEQRAEAEQQRAEAAQERAEAERQRAEAAEAELARLRALLAERGQA
jgi:Uma2 family endonuclease